MKHVIKKQQGVVLIVCLVILLVVALLGATAMQGAGLELKMVKNFEERQRVFQATEIALRAVESRLTTTPFTDTDLDSGACAIGSATCFDNTCAGGLCFFGTNTGAQAACQIYEDPVTADTDPRTLPPPSPELWLDAAGFNVWDTATENNFFGDFSTSSVAGTNDVTVRYIIEFQCYVDTSIGTVAGNTGDAAYRITALGANQSGLTEVMLQSTFATPAP